MKHAMRWYSLILLISQMSWIKCFRSSCQNKTTSTYLVIKTSAPSHCSCKDDTASIPCKLADNEYPGYYTCTGLSVYDKIQCCNYKKLIKCCDGWTGNEICNQPICIPACRNGGSCVSPRTCLCLHGFEGQSCQNPICRHPCDNGGTCIAPETCSCRPGYQGNLCQYGICSPTCKNNGTCVSPQLCSCLPGFYGKICEQGNSLDKLFEPTLSLANRLFPESWYTFASPVFKSCFVKVLLQVHDPSKVITFTAESYDSNKTSIGNYTALAVDKVNNVNETVRAACLNTKCPDSTEDGHNRNILVKIYVNTDLSCGLKMYNKDSGRKIDDKSFQLTLQNGNDYGPIYGIYIAYGSRKESEYLAQQMCFTGSNLINTGNLPSKNPSASFECQES